MNRSVVIDRKFAERTSREKKMIAARRSPVFSTPLTDFARDSRRLFAIKNNNRAEKNTHELLKYIEESIAVINGYC